MTLSENQVRHLYVLSGDNLSADNGAPVALEDFKKVGDFAISLTQCTKDDTPDYEYMYLQHKGKGGITRSDLIPLCNIAYVNATAAADMVTHPKKAVIKLAGELYPEEKPGFDVDADGEDDSKVPAGSYLVRICIDNYIGMSDDAPYYKYGQVVSNGRLPYDKFYQKLAKSLKANLAREIQPLFEINVPDSKDCVEIIELPQPWRLGHLSQEPVRFSVSLVPNDPEFEVEKEDGVMVYDWGTVEMVTDEDTVIPNSKTVADMEYFFMGERADIYRGAGWPLNVETQYMVSGDAAEGYDMIDIHYAYQGTCEDIQKSEKDITLVAEPGVLTDVLDLIEGYLKDAHAHAHVHTSVSWGASSDSEESEGDNKDENKGDQNPPVTGDEDPENPTNPSDGE